MRQYDWNTIEEAQEFERPNAGGYVCKIMAVEENEEKEYVKISYDIASGDFKAYYTDLVKKGYNYPTFVRSYKEKALPFFKAFLSVLNKSNDNFSVENFNGDVNAFIGLNIGLVLGEEEYLGNGGAIKTALKVQKILPTSEIINNNFKIPEVKKLNNNNTSNNAPTWEQVNDEELPF